MKRAFLAALVIAGVLRAAVPAQEPTADALKFFKNYFVTGDYVVGGVGLRGQGVDGIATGEIEISGAPPGAEVLAAFLYWQVVTTSALGPDSGSLGVTFNGHALQSAEGPFGKVLNTAGTPPCWSSGGTTGSSGGNKLTYTYRADVLRFLDLEGPGTADAPNPRYGKFIVNGHHRVQLPDSGSGGNALPIALGASLVVIYRDENPLTPLNAIVLYDGGYTLDNSHPTMYQTVRGFYQASGDAGGKLTHIVGTGQANKSETLLVDGTSYADPFIGHEGDSWDNFTVPVTLSANAAQVTTAVDPSSDCLTWGAVILKTPVKDSDDDGLLDVWEAATAANPLKDPHGRDLPYLGDMNASPTRKDLFVEIGYMNMPDADLTTPGVELPTYGGVEKKAHSHLPTPAAIKLMGDAFRNANVENPDGSTGITLHVDAGKTYPPIEGPYDYVIRDKSGLDLARGGEALDESITTKGCSRDPLVDPVWKCQFAAHPGTVGWKTGFRYIRDEVIGTTDGSPVPPPPTNPDDEDPCDAPDSKCVRRFDANRSDMFHYAFFAHAVGMPKSLNACLTTNTDGELEETPDVDGHCPAPLVENPLFFTPRTNSGIGDFPGRDVLITLGAFSDSFGRPGGTDFMVASTLFHELGHNIELRHGAWQPASGRPVVPAPNCVPNYLSAMNYLYQLRGLLDDSGKPHLDFSSGGEVQLDEAGGTDKPLNFPYRIGWYAPLKGSYFEYFDADGTARSRTTVAGRHCDGSLMFAGDPLMVRVDARSADSEIDWNANGILDGYANQDLNFNGRTDPRGSPELPPAFNDWANIHLNRIGAGRNVGAPFLDKEGRKAFGPLSANLARADWARADWARADWARADWARADWARADWARADWGDLSEGDLGRYGFARADWARADWARADWARADWARADWGRGDDGRGDFGGGDTFRRDPNNASGELDFETATLLANTPPYEFRACRIDVDTGCEGEEPGVRVDWTATNEGGESSYIVYRVEGAALEPGQAWVEVESVAAVPGKTDYGLIDTVSLVKGGNHLYFAVAVYSREIDGATFDVKSDPSNLVQIVGPNHPPVANARSVTTPEDVPVVITLTGSDVDVGDSLSFTITDPPASGTLSGVAPNLTYAPAKDFHGTDGFAFTASDGAAASAPAWVAITVTPVNDAPVAATGLSVNAAEDTPTAITLTGSDVDGNPLTFTVTALPAHGTLSGTAPNLTYTSALNYNGPDSLAFTVSDGVLASPAATVSITVTAVNDAPVAIDDSYPMPGEGFTLTVPARGVLANDGDIDSPVETLAAVLEPGSGPWRGKLSLNADGSFTYTPTGAVIGPDSFSYRATDADGARSNVATVRIVGFTLVGLQNVPPAAVSKSKAGASVPMKWQFLDGSNVVNSPGVHHTVTVRGTTSAYTVSDTDSGSSSFRYDPTTSTWLFNLQTKDASGEAYPVGDYVVTITPSTPGFLPCRPFVLSLTK